jgi:DNA-binding CsgD family transcriptional regulator
LLEESALRVIRAALLEQIEVTIRQGEREKLQQLLASAGSVRMPSDPQATAAATRAQAMLAAWDGRFARAYELLGPIRDRYESEERLVDRVFCAIFLAADGKHSAATDAMQALGATPSQPRSLAGYRVVAEQLGSIVEALAGRFTAARRVLLKRPVPLTTLNLVMHEAIARAVDQIEGAAHVDEAPDALRALGRHHYGGYLLVLDAVLRKVQAERAHTGPLTPAELAVLRCVAAGETPKTIAYETGRSVHTVRTQLRRVIEKFDCSGRDQAIRMARARALI